MDNEIDKNTDLVSTTKNVPITGKILALSFKYGPFILLAIIASFLIASYMEPETRVESHDWRLKLAALGIVLIVFRSAKGFVDRHSKKLVNLIITRIYFAILVLASTFGIFNYYQFDYKVAEGLDDYTDIAYYYLNTKYLEELGYFRFYAATLYADKEHKNRHASRIRRYRDLRDYKVKSTRVAFAHGKEIKEKHFSQARWKQFRHDVDWFLSKKTTRNLQGNFFVDHGYNPPPTWAVAGGILSDITPVESVKKIALVDAAFVVIMLIGVAWAFGFESMLFVLLFWITTFSGRWPVLGHSLLRFDWSSCLVLAVCMFKKDKWLLAGAFLSYAAFSRIFPAIFFLAWGVVAVVDIVRERKIPMRHVRVVAGALLVGGMIVGTALARYGPSTFEESAHNLLMHNQSYSSHRVGLGDIIMFEGETTRDEINSNGGMRKKELAIQDMQTELRLAGLLALGFVIFYMVRSRKPVHELIHLAILPLFCVTNPQINYYYVRLTLVVWHTAYLNHPLHRIGLVLIFAIEVVTQWVFMQMWARYTVTVTTSIGMAVYFGLLIIWMGYEITRSFIKKPLSSDELASK